MLRASRSKLRGRCQRGILSVRPIVIDLADSLNTFTPEGGLRIHPVVNSDPSVLVEDVNHPLVVTLKLHDLGLELMVHMIMS